MMRGRKGSGCSMMSRAKGGRVTPVSSGGKPAVIAAAREATNIGSIGGEKGKPRADRIKRASSGRVGADTSPKSSAGGGGATTSPYSSAGKGLRGGGKC